MKYKIHVYLVCWNEIKILPFVIDYWKLYAEKVVVYDNCSDDGSVELLSKYSPWIEVRRFETEGADNQRHIDIKNHCWKESRGKADFVVVCDTDECLFSPVLEQELDYMKENNMTLCGPRQYSLYGDSYPEYQEGKLLHEIISKVKLQKSNHSKIFITSGKIMLFDPNKIEETNFAPGCHDVNIKGEAKLYDGNKIFCIHINKGFGADYRIARCAILRDRRSKNDLKHGYGVHFFYSPERIRREYEQCVAESENFLDILNDIK